MIFPPSPPSLATFASLPANSFYLIPTPPKTPPSNSLPTQLWLSLGSLSSFTFGAGRPMSSPMIKPDDLTTETGCSHQIWEPARPPPRDVTQRSYTWGLWFTLRGSMTIIVPPLGGELMIVAWIESWTLRTSTCFGCWLGAIQMVAKMKLKRMKRKRKMKRKNKSFTCPECHWAAHRAGNFDTNTTRSYRVWVWSKRVWVIIGSTRFTHGWPA